MSGLTDPTWPIIHVMQWLDSNPVKLLNLAASLIAIAAAIGGGAFVEHAKGSDWGTDIAITAGALAGAGFSLLLYGILRFHLSHPRRDCPYCSGTGRVDVIKMTGYRQFARCPVCGGRGKIW